MLTLNIGNRELNVKYGVEATLKANLISRITRLQGKIRKSEEFGDGIASLEELLLLLPEMLLIGLQKYHKEYKYDVDKGTGKEKHYSAMFEIIEEYCDGEDKDAYVLFGELSAEMMNNGFLRSMFRSAEEQTEQK